MPYAAWRAIWRAGCARSDPLDLWSSSLCCSPRHNDSVAASRELQFDLLQHPTDLSSRRQPIEWPARQQRLVWHRSFTRQQLNTKNSFTAEGAEEQRIAENSGTATSAVLCSSAPSAVNLQLNASWNLTCAECRRSRLVGARGLPPNPPPHSRRACRERMSNACENRR
jgi:hypothetical protein